MADINGNGGNGQLETRIHRAVQSQGLILLHRLTTTIGIPIALALIAWIGSELLATRDGVRTALQAVEYLFKRDGERRDDLKLLGDRVQYLERVTNHRQP